MVKSVDTASDISDSEDVSADTAIERPISASTESILGAGGEAAHDTATAVVTAGVEVSLPAVSPASLSPQSPITSLQMNNGEEPEWLGSQQLTKRTSRNKDQAAEASRQDQKHMQLQQEENTRLQSEVAQLKAALVVAKTREHNEQVQALVFAYISMRDMCVSVCVICLYQHV